MAIYDNLPVFKAAYDLLLEIYPMCEKVSREYKFTLCEKLKNDVTELMVCIYEANSTHDKKPYIHAARQYVVKTKLYVRLLHDLKQLSDKRMAQLSDMTETVSKQLAAWNNSVDKPTKEKQK